MSTFYLCDAANGRNVHKLIYQPLSIHLGKDSSLIVISQSSAHRFIIHVWFVLVKTPQLGHGLAVHKFEDPLLSIHPLDIIWTTGRGLEQRQQEFPEICTAWIFWLLLCSLLIVTLTNFKLNFGKVCWGWSWRWWGWGSCWMFGKVVIGVEIITWMEHWRSCGGARRKMRLRMMVRNKIITNTVRTWSFQQFYPVSKVWDVDQWGICQGRICNFILKLTDVLKLTEGGNRGWLMAVVAEIVLHPFLCRMTRFDIVVVIWWIVIRCHHHHVMTVIVLSWTDGTGGWL